MPAASPDDTWMNGDDSASPGGKVSNKEAGQAAKRWIKSD